MGVLLIYIYIIHTSYTPYTYNIYVGTNNILNLYLIFVIYKGNGSLRF